MLQSGFDGIESRANVVVRLVLATSHLKAQSKNNRSRDKPGHDVGRRRGCGRKRARCLSVAGSAASLTRMPEPHRSKMDYPSELLGQGGILQRPLDDMVRGLACRNIAP